MKELGVGSFAVPAFGLVEGGVSRCTNELALKKRRLKKF